MRIFSECGRWARPARTAVAAGGGAAVVAGLVLAVAPAAQAQGLTCGTTLVASVTLTENLDCTTDTTGDALTIGAPGVTVNLNGFSILGPGDAADTYGITDSGYSGLTVEGGTIANFYYGVNVAGTSSNALTGIVAQHLTITDNTLGDTDYGFAGDFLSGANLSGLTVGNASTAVWLDESQDSTVTGSTVTGAFFGFEDEFGTSNTWSRSTVSTASYYEGTYAYQTTGDKIISNRFKGTASDGVFAFENTNLTVAHNVFSHTYDGVYDDNSAGTRITGNKGTGDTFGIYTDSETGAVYAGNTFNKGEYGIETDYPNSETMRSNTTNGNSEAGIYVYTGGQTGATVTLAKNTADTNAYGMYSQILTGGYHNSATGNTVENCYNVRCGGLATPHAPVPAPPHRPIRDPATPFAPGRRG